MPKRGKGGGKAVKVVEKVDRDDNDSNIDPNDFYQDEIDDFHSQRAKVLLDKGQAYGDGEESDQEVEVMGMDLSDDDLLSDDDIKKYKKQLRRLRLSRKKNEMGSDLEEEEDEPEIQSFGKKRSHFYVPKQDVDDDDIDLSGSEDEEGAAVLEEKESRALQLKMAKELDTQDFGLEIFKPQQKMDNLEQGQEKISKDLSKLTKSEKLQLLKKESPEMLTLIEDYKEKMMEVRDTLQPLLALVREGKLQGPAAEYIQTKTKLNLNYCTNVSFYMVLKAKRISVQNHPVIKRLVQYRNLMKELEPIDQQVKDEVTDVIERLRQGEDVDLSATEETKTTFVRRNAVKAAREKKEKKISELITDSDEDSDTSEVKASDDRFETEDEKAALEYYNIVKSKKIGANSVEEDLESDKDSDVDMHTIEDVEGYEDDEGKRAISYEIEKNKGLLPKRKREQRNPRVKHRMKFKKAKVKRKSQVKESRTEMVRYGGELSGIRAGIKRGIKIKV